MVDDRLDVREVLARVSLADIALADVGGWDRRESNFRRGDLWACCPFHAEKTPSFHVDVRKGLYKCFGCGAGGDVIDYVKRARGLDFRGALEWLAREGGVHSPRRRKPVAHGAQARRNPRRDDTARRRLARARAIWRASQAAANGPVREYLRGRGLMEPPPESLRFHPRLPHPAARGGLPAMVAVMAGPGGRFAGVHRTFLAGGDDGGWRKASVKPVKMMLGVARAACVRLTPAAERLHLAEGIETAMAVLQVLRAQGEDEIAVWAAMSLSNMGRAWVPPEVREVVLVADNDTKDWRAGRRTMREAARMHAQSGRVVRTVWPPRGLDFLDWINGGGVRATA